MKKLLMIIVGIAIISGIIYISKPKEAQVNIPLPIVEKPTPNPLKLCFYRDKIAGSGYHDISWISINILGDKVNGEFQTLPAEKDKKIGTYEGTVGPVDRVAMARTANVWWSSMAEGMNNKEQLKIVFGEGTAQAAFGEMVDRGDGVYIYKDESKLKFGEPMTDTNCDDIPSMLAVANIQGNTCYAYHQVATPDAPYKADEYIKLTVAGDKVTGTKKGTQSGPDLTNGYTGTLKGMIDKKTLSVLFSYTVEGAKNTEREIYTVLPAGLQKERYPLIENKNVLEPDTSKTSKPQLYENVDCGTIR
jgi:hypothetical protein